MVLVDSSVWIAYFRGDETALPLNELIDSNTLCINGLILAELIPSIIHRKEEQLKDLLLSISTVDISCDWERLIEMQAGNLAEGINNVGVADLIIAQNAIDHELELYSLDRHFHLMSGLHGLKLYPPA